MHKTNPTPTPQPHADGMTMEQVGDALRLIGLEPQGSLARPKAAGSIMAHDKIQREMIRRLEEERDKWKAVAEVKHGRKYAHAMPQLIDENAALTASVQELEMDVLTAQGNSVVLDNKLLEQCQSNVTLATQLAAAQATIEEANNAAIIERADKLTAQLLLTQRDQQVTRLRGALLGFIDENSEAMIEAIKASGQRYHRPAIPVSALEKAADILRETAD